MNNINKGILPLNFLIAAHSTEDTKGSAYNIKNGNNSKNKWWYSVRFCSYPQYIIIQFMTSCEIKQINFTISHDKIPKQIDLFYFSPSNLNEYRVRYKNFSDIKFEFCGSLNPKYHIGNQREVIKIPFCNGGNNIRITNCLYLKILFRENYIDEVRNPFNQIGIVNLEFFGYPSELNLQTSIFSKNEKFYMQGLNKDDEYIDEIKTKIFYAKKRYFAHQTDRGIYEDIEQLRYFGNIIIELKEERIKDTILNDTCTVNKIDKEIEDIVQYVNDTYRIYNQEVIIYENDDCVDYTNTVKHVYYDEEEDNSTNVPIQEQHLSEDNKIAMNVVVAPKEMDTVSREIYERRMRKKEMIQKSLEDAKEKLKVENSSKINI